jgi:hypothetical protein
MVEQLSAQLLISCFFTSFINCQLAVCQHLFCPALRLLESMANLLVFGKLHQCICLLFLSSQTKADWSFAMWISPCIFLRFLGLLILDCSCSCSLFHSSILHAFNCRAFLISAPSAFYQLVGSHLFQYLETHCTILGVNVKWLNTFSPMQIYIFMTKKGQRLYLSFAMYILGLLAYKGKDKISG